MHTREQIRIERNIRMNTKRFFLLGIFSCLIIMSFSYVFAAPPPDRSSSDEAILREVQDLYMNYSVALMKGDFRSAYDMLSLFTKKRVTYDIFVDANLAMEDMFRLKGSHLNNLLIRGKYGAAKAITYVDFMPEKKGDEILNGKIETQIYFIKEGNKWKIATGNDDNTDQFLQENPEAKDLMERIKTRVYYKKGGYWITFDYKYDKEKALSVPR